MTIRLDSLGEMAVRLIASEAAMMESLQHGLERVLVKIEATAKREIGTYQPAAGPFPAWVELADTTKDDRVKQGYTENDPLLRSGDLRDSIGHEVHVFEGAVGSTSEIMPYQEFGTQRIPPRPVLGPAAFLNKEAIHKLIGAALVTGLIGKDQVHEALGYDFTTTDL